MDIQILLDNYGNLAWDAMIAGSGSNHAHQILKIILVSSSKKSSFAIASSLGGKLKFVRGKMLRCRFLRIILGGLMSTIAMQHFSRPTRRDLLGAGTSAVVSWSIAPGEGKARGLVEFPCTRPLSNSYHLMRSGTSLLEEEGQYFLDQAKIFAH